MSQQVLQQEQQLLLMQLLRDLLTGWRVRDGGDEGRVHVVEQRA